jgi:hypothetical protein
MQYHFFFLFNMLDKHVTTKMAESERTASDAERRHPRLELDNGAKIL